MSAEYRMSIAVDASGASSGVDNVAKAFANLEKYLSSMDRTLTGTEQGLNKTGTVASKASQNLDKSSKSFDRVEKEAKQAGDSIKDAGKDMDGMNGAVTKLNSTLGMLKGAFMGAMAFAGVGSVMQTADAMKTLDGQIKMATGSAEKHAFAMSEIERIAMANNVSLSSVGEMYVSNERALKQLGKSQEEVVKFTEQVTTAMRLGGGSAESQAAALTQLGQALASGVLRGDEFNSIAEQAPMIMELMADSLNVTTGELRKMAAEGKLTADVVYNAMTSAGATEKLASMASQSSTTIGGALENVRTQWDLAVHGLMNSEGGISSIIAGGISLIADGLSKFGDYIPQINEYISGVISKAKELGTAFLESEVGKATIEGLKLAFDGLKSAVQGVSDFVGGIKQLVLDNSEAFTALASGVSAAATAFLVIKASMAIQALFASGAVAVGLLTGAMSIATGASAAFGAVMAFVTSPITLAVVAIGALVAVSVYLYRNWGKVSDIIGGTIEQILINITELKDTVVNAFNNLVQSAIAKFNELKAQASAIFNGLSAPVRTALTAIAGIFTAQFTIVKTLVTTSLNLVKNIFATVFNVIKALVRGDMQGVKTAISNGMQNAWSVVKTGVGNIVGAFAGLGAKLKQAGIDAIQGLIDGIGSKFRAVSEKVSQIAGLIPDGVRSLLNIRSPSRVMRELGAWAGEGFVLGVGDKVKDAKQMAQDLANALTSTVADLHRQHFMLKNHANPLAEWQYKVQFGELAELTDKQKARVLELARANLDLAKSNDINKSISDEIISIDEKLQTHGMNRLQILEWQIANTQKYKDANEELLTTLKDQIQIESELNQLFSTREKLKDYQSNLAKNTYLYRNKDDKYAGERWDLSKQGFDGKYIDQMIETLRQSDVMSAMANMPKTLTMPTLQNNNLGSAVSSAVTGYFDLKKQLDDNLAIIKEAENGKLITEQESQLVRLEQEKAFHEARQNLVMAGADNILGSMANATKEMLGEQSSAYRAMFAMQQGFAIGAAIVNVHKAISDAFAEGTTLAQKFAGMATATTQGMKIVSAIQSIKNPVIGQAHDGIMSVPKSGTWNLEKGERVLPKHTAKAMDDKLDSIGNGGVNVIINNYSSEKASVEKQSNGDIMVTIGMMREIARAESQKTLRDERKQGGLLYGV